MPESESRALNARAIARRRFVAQHLATPRLRDAAAVVAALGAVQAQDYAGAKWAVAQRARGVGDADLDRAIATGAIVRTHVLRPTWHFVVPADARWLLELTAPRVLRAMAYQDRTLGIDARMIARSNDALARTVEGGHRRTRAELGAALDRAGIDASDGQRVGHLLMHAELDAVLCSGGRRGKQITWALFDERVPAAPPRDRDEALLEIVVRYLATRAPATVRDIAWWSGLTAADVRRGIAAAEHRLTRREVDGREHWLPADGEPRRGRAGVARLLPNFDELYVGFADRSAALVHARGERLLARDGPLAGHVVAIDGQIVAGWRRREEPASGRSASSSEGRVIRLELLPVTRLSAVQRRAIATAARDYGAFLGRRVKLTPGGRT